MPDRHDEIRGEFRMRFAAFFAALAALWVQPAAAAQYLGYFAISEPWVIGTPASGASGLPPFGMTGDSDIHGSVLIDDALSGANRFIGLDLITGSRPWTLADILSDSQAQVTDGVFVGFILSLADGNGIASHNSAILRDGNNVMSCNACVRFGPDLASVPEPSTWMMTILGLGLAGGAMRRRRAHQLIDELQPVLPA
jgi:hypothetical protein